METRLEKQCLELGLKMTDQRRVVIRVLSDAEDHPDVEEVYRRASAIDPRISLATVYRTVRLLEDLRAIKKLDFGDGRARYEEASERHHHHLIDTRTGAIVEFSSPELDEIKNRIGKALGYRISNYRLELYGIRAEDIADSADE
jgi:Fur family transcriptional regulator, ferric uptake regulator